MTFEMESKLSATRAGPHTRIWLQGARLIEYGFSPGSKFRKNWTAEKLILTPISETEFKNTTMAERGTISGNTARPVIDIVGRKVVETFGNPTATAFVTVTFSKNKIVIKA